MRRGGPRVWRGLAVAGFVVGLVVLAAGGVFSLMRGGWIADAAGAEGRVVALTPGGRGYSPTVLFTPAGAEDPVRFTVGWSSNPPAYDVDAAVPVLYRPADPSDAVIDAHFALWWPAYVLGGVGLLFCILGTAAGAASIWTARR